MPYCPDCAIPISADARACPNCLASFAPGQRRPLEHPPDLSQPQSHWPVYGLAVQPAPRAMRWGARLLDTVLVTGVSGVVAFTVMGENPFLFKGMFEYTYQQFANYFVLVGLAFLMVVLTSLAAAATGLHASPGQWVFGLQLQRWDGSEATTAQRWWRTARILLVMAVLLLPGPVIALLIGLSAAMAFATPFVTLDAVLRYRVPDLVRYAAHAVSFVLLGWALWWVVVKVWAHRLDGYRQGLSWLDAATKTTVVRGRGRIS